MDQNEQKAGQVEGEGADGDNILDDMDCRPENLYPEANREAATPDYIRDMLAAKKKPAEPGAEPEPSAPAEPAQPENKNPA